MAKIFVYLTCIISSCLAVDPDVCKCSNKANCNPVVSWNKADREVIIAVNRTDTDFEGWMWESITTVLQMGGHYRYKLMCYTHGKGRKYGVFENMPVYYEANSSDVSDFIGQLKDVVRLQNADIIALDLLELLGSCGNTDQHTDQIISVVTKVINETKSLHKDLKILCVMPWKPPCYEYNCGITPALQPHCDGVIISPESFTTYCTQSCRARATVPFTKLFLGLDEYEAAGMDREQLIMGIPWHGYNYTCTDFGNNTDAEGADHVCSLKTKMVDRAVGNTTKQVQVCDIEGSRDKVAIGPYLAKNPTLLMDQKVYSRSQQAPSVTGKDDQNHTHMIWFENYASLASKYSVAYHHGLKGVIIYQAEDLQTSKIPTGKHFNDEMWSWLLHTVLATSTHEYKKETRNVAGLVAGVGIGMFVFGVLLGTIIACIRFKQKETLRPPFRKDYHKSRDYHDEDPDL